MMEKERFLTLAIKDDLYSHMHKKAYCVSREDL
jgi:hypothetical protein